MDESTHGLPLPHHPQSGANSQRKREPVKPLPDFVDLIAALDSQEEKERVTNELFTLAQEIWELVQLKRSNSNTLPHGTLPAAAQRLGLSTDQVWRLVKRMDKHDLDRKAGKSTGLRAEAVIHKQRGRQKGKRDYPDDITEFIVDAWRNPNWESLNHLGLVDPIHRRITVDMVHKLVQRKYPDLKISLMTVWRIINDFVMNNGAKAAYGRGKEDEAKEHLTAIDADFGNPNNIWITDIRPLPIKSKYKNIECTVGILYIMDGASTNVLRHKLLPRKDSDEEENVFGVDFTCHHVRIEFGLAMAEAGKRPRLIYVDNGSQFGKAFEKFLDLLTAEGEEPTQIIHTNPYEPQGRGVLERALGLIDDFIQFKPGFFEEDNYRKSLRNKKKYPFYEFSFLEKEFDHFMPIRNATPKRAKSKEKQPPPIERYKQGPDQGLTPPSLLYLGLFIGSAERIKDRVPSREGIRYANKHFALVDESPEMGAKLAGIARHHQAKPTFVIKFETLIVLYVKIDEQQWVLFVEKGKRQWSAKKQRAWKDSIIKYLADDQRASEARIQMALVDDVGTRLVIESYQKDFIQYEEDDAQAKDEEAKNSSESKTPAAANEEANQSSEAAPEISLRSRQSKRQRGRRAKPTQATNADGHPSSSEMEDEDDVDVPNFMIQRMNNLRKRDEERS